MINQAMEHPKENSWDKLSNLMPTCFMGSLVNLFAIQDTSSPMQHLNKCWQQVVCITKAKWAIMEYGLHIVHYIALLEFVLEFQPL